MNPDYQVRNDDVTGSRPAEKFQILRYPFDRFEIFVQLADNGQFRGISEIRINADFLTIEQKIKNIGSAKLEEFYPQDEPISGK